MKKSAILMILFTVLTFAWAADALAQTTIQPNTVTVSNGTKANTYDWSTSMTTKQLTTNIGYSDKGHFLQFNFAEPVSSFTFAPTPSSADETSTPTAYDVYANGALVDHLTTAGGTVNLTTPSAAATVYVPSSTFSYNKGTAFETVSLTTSVTGTIAENQYGSISCYRIYYSTSSNEYNYMYVNDEGKLSTFTSSSEISSGYEWLLDGNKYLTYNLNGTTYYLISTSKDANNSLSVATTANPLDTWSIEKNNNYNFKSGRSTLKIAYFIRYNKGVWNLASSTTFGFSASVAINSTIGVTGINRIEKAALQFFSLDALDVSATPASNDYTPSIAQPTTTAYPSVYRAEDNSTNAATFGGITIKAAKDGADLSSGGYLTVSQITSSLASSTLSKEGILYIDASACNAISGTDDEWTTLKGSIAPNALIFLPKGSASSLNNMIVATDNGYQACANIVLTDQQPFYNPHPFTLTSSQTATYIRTLSKSHNGKVSKATLMLPFTVALTNGTHSNSNCTIAFYHLKNVTTSAVTGDAGSDFSATATFDLLTDATTIANKPYLVQITKATSDDNVSFAINETGTSFAATGSVDTTVPGDANTQTSTIGGTSYDFTIYGTYTGLELPTTDNVFYFANNKFYSIRTLTKPGIALPFRAFFRYVAKTNAAKMDVTSFDIDLNNASTQNVTAMPFSAALKIVSGKGTLLIMSDGTAPVTVTTLTGQRIAFLPPTSDTHRIALPHGIYLVNGQKAIVK